ncbi:short-chain dehydrogenase [candidate division MSBL1 archaeon SCGC-AAA382M17]|uniref:Short-chain dehydrogenase n=1 Tax=candidate division MSBL1 archaeon SCGC-AAA382M17 TaxID=1698284 RepID=A0ABR5TJX2_9EURY|nr:short-chain dehydrogenase [candidate division MSBL1 archaeon SCGC-AAA382M17]
MRDKVIIITGASSGIGKACTYVFSEQGAKITIAARNEEKLKEIESDLKTNNREVLAVKTDVSIANDCKSLIEKTIDKFGRIDVLINNAGLSMRGLFEDVQLEVLERVMNVNFWGTVYCTKYALPYLIKAKGSVIGISSVAGFQGLPGRTGYSSSKFAMHGFLETLRVETLKKNLHVMIVAPGFTSTNVRKAALGPDGKPQGESPRDESKMMPPEKVAEGIARGIKKRKRVIIMTTEGKLTVLLKKIVPKFLDKLTYKIMAREPNSPFK